MDELNELSNQLDYGGNVQCERENIHSVSYDQNDSWSRIAAVFAVLAGSKSLLHATRVPTFARNMPDSRCATFDAFEHLVGKQECKILGKTDDELFTKHLADNFRAKDSAAVEARCARVDEVWLGWSDTSGQALLEMRRVPVFGGDGNLTGLLGVARDITERKRFEELLAEREREFRTLVEHSPDTVARYGSDFRRLYVNPTLAALVEGGASSLIGRKPSGRADCGIVGTRQS
ncbi:MAG TPA: PAS domain-containing protein [Paraburkholderia sp.]|uniref:PAS domain-containing protein n=1 Tax=Paraburkholderia sp. TaxID=1926495 RepID=UPI002B47E414|nr:PAS domain-containing protein [Paraburkholderia sp.]HKR41067.1 PAS domain-containing protein [Paraburkholderia sp.]